MHGYNSNSHESHESLSRRVQAHFGLHSGTSKTGYTRNSQPAGNSKSVSSAPASSASANQYSLRLSSPEVESAEVVSEETSVEKTLVTNYNAHSNANSRTLFPPATGNTKYRVSIDHDPDDDLHGDFSFEDFSGLSLGRRYHPEGVPLSNKPLFIPSPAKQLNEAAAAPATFNNPFMYVPKESSEEDDGSFEMPIVRLTHSDSKTERIALSESVLNDRYNFVDAQGSVNWGYTLDDQHQNAKVHTDGTIEGDFGWTAPNGQEIKVQYVADNGGYRILSSSNIHPAEAPDVQLAREQHLKEVELAANRVAIGKPLPPIDLRDPTLPAPINPDFTVTLDDDESTDLMIGSTGSVGTPLPAFDPATCDLLGKTDPSLWPIQCQNTGAGDETLIATGFGKPLPNGVISSGGDVATNVDSFGVGLPTTELGVSNTGLDTVGVGLPSDTSVGFGADSGTSEPGFGFENVGVALPSNPTSGTAGDAGFGTGLDATFGAGDANLGAGFGSDVGVALPSNPTSGTAGDAGFGTGLDATFGVGDADLGAGFGSDVGVALPSDPTTGTTGDASFGTGLDATFGAGDASFGTGLDATFGAGDAGFGTGLDATFGAGEAGLGAGFGSDVGVALPSDPTTGTTGDASFGTGLDATFGAGDAGFGTGLDATFGAGEAGLGAGFGTISEQEMLALELA